MFSSHFSYESDWKICTIEHKTIKEVAAKDVIGLVDINNTKYKLIKRKRQKWEEKQITENLSIKRQREGSVKSN